MSLRRSLHWFPPGIRLRIDTSINGERARDALRALIQEKAPSYLERRYGRHRPFVGVEGPRGFELSTVERKSSMPGRRVHVDIETPDKGTRITVRILTSGDWVVLWVLLVAAMLMIGLLSGGDGEFLVFLGLWVVVSVVPICVSILAVERKIRHALDEASRAVARSIDAEDY
jgi:hypothetical protein